MSMHSGYNADRAYNNGTSVPIPPLERHDMTPNEPNRHVHAHELKRDDNVVIDVNGNRRIGKVWAILPPRRKSTDYIDIALYPQGYHQRTYTVHKLERIEVV